MGKRYLHSIAAPRTAILTGASITPFDLPVNPLSFVLLRLQVTRTVPAAILTYDAIDELINAITGIRVLHKGEQIISGNLRDLMILNAVYMRAFPGFDIAYSVGTPISNLVFPICLGKRMYDPESCFPATSRGNLRFEMDTAVFPTMYSALSFSLETVELIESTPTEYLKYVRQARVSVAGQFDAPLPIGNPLVGILLYDTGIQTTFAGLSSWGDVKLLKDNVEQYYPLSNFVTLAAQLHAQMGSSFALHQGHSHKFVDADALTSITAGAGQVASTALLGYAYLDFDPLRDASYEMETAGAADIKIRGLGLAASDVRYYPLERVTP